MENIISYLNSAGNSFVDFAWPMLIQSSILIIILFGLDLVLRRKVRAVVRYGIWMLVLVKLVLPPSLTSPTGLGYWVADRLPEVAIEKVKELPASQPMDTVVVPSLPPVGGYESRRSTEKSATGLPAAPPEIVHPTAMNWQSIVLAVWLVGVIVLAVLLLQRLIFVKGLISQSDDVGDPLSDALSQCSRQMAMRRRIMLRLSPNAASPSVCGLFRPVILIPHGLVDKLTEPQLRAVLLHELAHIRRGDLWVSFIQTALQILYFYNPLLWLANALIRKVREQAVDEMVLVAMGSQAEDYPDTLLNVSKLIFRRPALSLRLIGVVESKSALKTRIKHIVSRPFPKSAKLGLTGLVAVILTSAILLPMAKGNFNDIPLFDNPPSTLHMAAFKGNLKAVKQFIHDGIDVNSRGPDGERPLCFAVYGNRINMVRFLLDNGADINAANDSQSTPLHGAAWKGFRDVAELLIIRGAEVNAVDKMGKTPLDNAIDQNHPRLIKLIRKHIEISTKTENSGFKKTLHNGVTVELVGVCEHPSKGKQWWQPDGSLLKVMPYAKLNDREAYNDLRMFEIVYRLSGPGKAVSKIIRTDEMPGYLGPYDMKRDIEKAAAYSEDCVYAMIPVVDGLDEVDINIACGTEVDWQWHARVTSPVTNSGMNTDQLDLNVSTGEQGYAVANVTHRIYDKEVRVIAKDKSGKLYHPKSLRGKTMDWAGVITAKFDISADDIESVEVQTQEFQTVEFKNVSLQGGHKTDVEIEVKKTDVQVEGEGIGLVEAKNHFSTTLPNGIIVELLNVSDGSGDLTINSIRVAELDGEKLSLNTTSILVDVVNNSDREVNLGLAYYTDSGKAAIFFSPGASAMAMVRKVRPNWQGMLEFPMNYHRFAKGGYVKITLAKCSSDLIEGVSLPQGVEVIHEKKYNVISASQQKQVVELLKTLRTAKGRDRFRAAEKLSKHSRSVVPAIIPMLQDNNVWAAYALGEIGPEAEDAVPALIKSLTQGGVGGIRGFSASALRKIGPAAVPAIPALIESLKDEHYSTRMHAADALGILSTGEKDVIDALTTTLKDENEKVRKEAAWALKQIQERYREDKTQNSPFTATLPSGVTVELVGVADYPSKGGQSWWQADGTVLAKPPYDGSDIDIMSIAGEDIRKIELAIKLGGNTNGPGWEAPVKRVDGKNLWSGGRRRENGQIVDDIKSIAIVCPSKQEELALRLYIAAGPWENVSVVPKNSLPVSSAGVMFSVPQQTANGTTITVSDSHLEYDSRIIAIDLEDKIYTASRRNISAETTDNIRQTTVNFDLELSKIKEFRFQTRPYECVEFKNVSLQPGHKTDIEIEVKKTDVQVEGVEKRKAYLADLETPNAKVVLDFATGQMLSGQGMERDRQYFEKLGKGDVCYDYAKNQGSLLCLRRATLKSRENKKTIPLEPDVKRSYFSGYFLKTIPCSYQLTTHDGTTYEVHLLSMDKGDKGGVHLEYWKSDTASPTDFKPVVQVEGAGLAKRFSEWLDWQNMAEYSGIVQNENGESIPKVKVRAVWSYPVEPLEITEFTDNQGRFNMTLPKITEKYTPLWEMFFEHPDYALGWLGPETRTRHKDPKNLKIVLYQPTTVSGIVENSQGKPVAGAKIYADIEATPKSKQNYPYLHLNSKNGLAVKTDNNGQFVFEKIPVWAKLTDINVEAKEKGYVFYSAKGKDKEFSVAAGTNNLILTLETAGAIRGRLLLDAKPYPREGVRIYAWDPNLPNPKGYSLQWTETDNIGQFEIKGVPQGNYTVTFAISPSTQFTEEKLENIKVTSTKTTYVEFDLRKAIHEDKSGQEPISADHKTALQVEGNGDKYNLIAKGGKGSVEALDPNAANLISDYLRALEKSDWKTALSVCSINVKDKAQQYPTPESFFNTVVPVKEILNQLRDPTIGSRQSPLKYSAYIFDVGISRPDMPRVVSWQWKARKLEGRANWEIDFPAIPFETWLANEKQVTIRAIKESEQLTEEMAPRLKGVRTLLTAKKEEFVVGEPIYFCLQIINQGDSILNYDCQKVAVNNSMTIEGPDGKEVKYTAESVQTAGGPVLLKPGVTKTLFDQLDITKQYDMRQQGQYRVQFNGNGLSFVVGKEDIFELSDPKSWRYYRSILPSNVVAITIHSDIKQETLDVRKDGVEDEKAVSQTNTEDKRDV